MTGLAEIRATSIEVEPVSGNLVVLSSKPPLVLEIDLSGRAVGMKRLAAKYHPQAEGSRCPPDAIWIADEGTAKKGTLTEVFMSMMLRGISAWLRVRCDNAR